MTLAVFDDEIQMDTDQTGQRGWDHPNVRGKKTLQGKRAQVWPAAQSFQYKSTEKRNTSRDLCADRCCPVGSLVPGKQITCETHANRCQQKTDANQPRHLTRIL